MPEFTQDSVNKLVGVPWSIKVTSSPEAIVRETCYFFKYTSDSSNDTCSFMITDTINVWAEILDPKYTSHRARHAHSARGSTKRGFALPYHESDEESDWRRGVVRTLGQVHESVMEGNVEFEVRESEVADLSVYVSDPGRDFHWRWDVMSIGRMAAGILSKQLFMPMVTLATVTSSLGQPADEVSEETLRTLAERKASTAKVMPAHHLRGFFSRPAVQTTLKCIAQVDAAPNLSNYESSNTRLIPTPSIDMADPPQTRDAELGFRRSTSSSGDRSDPTKASRRGKGRDDTDDEDDGSVRKIRRGATPRRSAAGIAESPTVRRDLFTRPRYDPDSTTTEAETTRDMSTRAGNSQTMDEDHLEPSSQPPPHIPSPRYAPTRSSPRDKLPRSSPTPIDNSDVFGATQNETQTQASSDDSDREAELERRVRAAGMIGSAAVRTPAGGGLGARMIRKKF